MNLTQQKTRTCPNAADHNILLARAQALAQVPQPPDEGPALELVTFRLAHETYAIESSFVREVCSLKDLTPLPCAPEFVTGIVNIRGQVLSVVDLKRFFDLPSAGLSDRDRLVILSDGIMEFGILADAILGVGNRPSRTLQAAPPTLTGIRQDFLRGIAPDGLIVLDGAKLLADARLIVNEEAR